MAPYDPATEGETGRRPTAAELADYERFKITESGVSPISHPGMKGGNYLASGIEHNEDGAPTSSGEVHARMNEKRLRKLEPLKRRRDLFLVEGGRARKVPVELGLSDGSAVEVLSGAKAGDLLVASDMSRYRDLEEIRISN